MNYKNKKAIFIIHFQPLERFPPVTNLLDYLANNTNEKIFVASTSAREESLLRPYCCKTKEIIIKRTPGIIPGSFLRLFHYMQFYWCTLFLLIKIKPSSVLYFETLSSWPALVYRKLRGNKVKLLLHCHEYTSPENYNDMWLVKQMHKMETKRYPYVYDWISHTNSLRLEQFKKDHSLQKVDQAIFHIMPNYPPKQWSDYINNFGTNNKIKLIFVGSLGYDNMYLKEIVNWVIAHNENFTLDFYTYNIDEKAKKFLRSIPPGFIMLHNGCNYDELPGILKQYDVGLVLYKPYNFNHINGISNKVYEYLACGLDVWFPVDNTYMLSLARNNFYPKINALDFNNLDNFNYKEAMKRDGLGPANEHYFAENIYSEIYHKINTCFTGYKKP